MVGHGLFKRKRLLTERQSALLAELRTILEHLEEALKQFGVDVAPADMQVLRDTLEHLDELFLLVIAGEYNSGKSSFINALLGAAVLAEGVTPTTDRITLLRYGAAMQEELHDAYLVEQTYPADVLRQLIIVDTPGTNAVIRRHEELTRNFIPRSDLVLFTTSADRPFTESERAFLVLIKDWGKKIVFILNKIDILDDPELDQVLAFIRGNAQDLLGVTPAIFPVSARLALRSRQSDKSDELWETSRFGMIERYIIETLDAETRVRLKLLSPLGVAQRLAQMYLTVTEDRLGTLRDDCITLENIEQQLKLFRADIMHDAEYHLKEIDVILRELEERGIHFFDETIRVTRIRDLIRSEQFQATFEEQVVSDVSQQIERRVQQLIDWMIEKDLRLWQSTMDYINRRRASQYRDRIIGEVGGAFNYNRSALLESVGRTANTVVTSYDKKHESHMLADEVRASIAATAITQAGAVGLGALLVVLFHSIWLDMTGILAATVVAIGGFYLLPAKRKHAKKTFRERIDTLRTELRQGVQQQFEHEVDRSLTQVHEAIEPYTRFVRSQRERLTDLQRLFSDIDVMIERLRTDIER